MITDVYLVYNDEEQIRKIGGTYTLKVSPFFTYINESSQKGRKEAFALKSYWGARLAPFAIVYDGEKAVKAFYSETDKDVIGSLIKYLNEQQDNKD